MLICLACRRQDGDHSLDRLHISKPDEDRFIREFMDDNAELFESERLTHPIGGGPKRVPVQTTDEFLGSYPGRADAARTLWAQHGHRRAQRRVRTSA